MKRLLMLFPFYAPQNVEEQGPLAILKYKLLQTVLLIELAAVGTWYAFRLRSLFEARSWNQVSLYTLILVTLVCLIVYNKRSLQWRAAIFLAMLFLQTTITMVQTGLTMVTLVMLFALAFFAVMFFGTVSLVGIVVWASVNAAIFAAAGRGRELADLFSNMTLETAVSALAISLCAAVVIMAPQWISYEYRKIHARQLWAMQALQDERNESEHRLQEQTLHLQHHILEASVAADISRKLSTVLDPDLLIKEAVSVIQECFKLYYIGIFLIDDDEQYAILRAGSDEAGQTMLKEGHRLPINGTSMVGWAISNRKARITTEASREEIRYLNPHLPHTRSEIALPIPSQEGVLGALSLQSVQPNAFDDDDVTILQGIADNLGAAFENAQRFQDIRETLEESRLLAANYLSQSWNEVTHNQGQLGFTYENPLAEHLEDPVEHQFQLTLRDTVIGKLSLEAEQDKITPEDKVFIDAVAAQTAIALENARLLEKTQRRAMGEQKLNELTEQFSHASGIEDILKRAVRELGDLPTVTEVSVHLVPPQPIKHDPGNNGTGNDHQSLEVSL
ncbi:MAG TPA: GAF domain-containing protein [Anaerolineaceae bacterium]|nr:GAF domain-containing protein [Anaerolineaceae bacterium]